MEAGRGQGVQNGTDITVIYLVYRTMPFSRRQDQFPEGCWRAYGQAAQGRVIAPPGEI